MITEVLVGVGTAVILCIALAVLWLPIMKFMTSGSRRDPLSWQWDFREYIVFWVKIICWTIITIPLAFFALVSLLKGEILASAVFVFISITFFSIQKQVSL